MRAVALRRTPEPTSTLAIPSALVRDLLAVVLLTGCRRPARSRLEGELGPELLARLDGRFRELGLRQPI